ncbi:PIN/TRAM domain-containing protein [Paenibacillus protaetiae]|uniref:PIN/TRAM domain-containing protein n=1 Tax=Paenibacillus protaetiae TaxID=2509456 RepID=A0A4V0YFI5_9BACL|nr:PIN/TRAM domain-containing protein [Paenibacillus protaetiae]QAY67831.1 PIN/TRAM domain-containing protein [Paenibacillus protaetiae]
MIKRIIQFMGLLIGGLLGNEWYGSINGLGMWSESGLMQRSGSYYLYVGAGAMIGIIVATLFAGTIIRLLERGSEKAAAMPMQDLLAGAGGMLMGLLLAVLLYPAVPGLKGIGQAVPAVMALGFGYIGMRIGLRKKEELAAGLSMLLEPRKAERPNETGKGFEEHKILDTSVIIDGRIADICKTGFIEGTLVIPEFVLEELQHIADSSDLLKRNRGRRGLDILNKIQKELDVKVLIYEGDFEEIGEVDSKLVKLAKVLGGKVVTNDFNLNKVCELQGVSVLNINDLANAVKPVVLPGEEIIVQVIKDGKEHGQGVAYLDDGTMIVVEGGRDYIGTTMEVLVTSVLQTSAGRMIFAKPKLLEKAL